MTTLLETLNHPPVELRFGTSGLRGLVTDMTDLECYVNTRGFMAFLEATSQIGNDNVYVGADLRASSPRIAAAVVQAIQDAGLHARYCGLVPIPALAYFSLQQKAACVMITGSHIPADRNGIKFYKPDGEVLKRDEAAMFNAVASIRASMYSQATTDSPFDTMGQLRRPPQLSPLPLQTEVLRAYSQRYLAFFGPNLLSHKQIIVYQHSSVGRDLLVTILEQLGAKVIAVGRSEKFIPIDTENVTPIDQAYFLKTAQEHPDCFAIVSADGDADRPFVVDETGTFHRGDVVGALTAWFLDATYAAFPVSASDAVATFLNQHGIRYALTKIGSPYVIAAMEEHSGKGSVSWEVNGGFLTTDPFSKGRSTLLPLPTRDALLPILAVLSLAAQGGLKVSELFSQLPARFTAAGLLDEVQAEQTQRVIEHLRSPAGQMEVAKLGIGQIRQTNGLDGERITFANGDIVHLRQSGNAPQLRVYSVANTQSRADELVREAIAPSGWLAQLLGGV